MKYEFQRIVVNFDILIRIIRLKIIDIRYNFEMHAFRYAGHVFNLTGLIPRYVQICINMHSFDRFGAVIYIFLLLYPNVRARLAWQHWVVLTVRKKDVLISSNTVRG